VHAFSPDGGRQRRPRTGLSIEDFLIKAARPASTRCPARRGDPRRRGPLGPHQGQAADATWIEVVTTAHRVGIPTTLDDDVRPRRQPAALGHPPARARPDPGRDRRRSPSSCRCRSCTPRPDLPRRRRPPGPTLRDNLAGPRAGPDPAARPDPNIQTRWVKLGVDGTRAMLHGRRQRPRRHPDGGDHLPDGRLRARLRQDRRGAASRSAPASAARASSAPRRTASRHADPSLPAPSTR
jgi:FO synthase